MNPLPCSHCNGKGHEGQGLFESDFPCRACGGAKVESEAERATALQDARNADMTDYLDQHRDGRYITNMRRYPG